MAADQAPETFADKNPQRAQELYDEFKPSAIDAYFQYFNIRTPVELWPYMEVLIRDDLPRPPLATTEAVVKDGDTVMVMYPAGNPMPGTPGVFHVINSTVLDITKNLGTDHAVVAHGETVIVIDHQAAAYPGVPGVIHVLGGMLQSVEKDLGPTSTVVTDGAPVQVRDAADASVPGSPGIAAVSAHAIDHITLSV